MHMRSRKVLLGLACVSAGTALFVGTAHADRRSGLAGNLLIEDPDDLFPFPQYTLVHRNMIRLDYAGAAGGNGVLTLGDDNMAYGLAIHRGDIINPDTVGISQELVWAGGVGDPFADGTPGDNDTTFAGPQVDTVRPAGVMQGAPGATTTAAAGAPLPATVFDLVVGGRLSGTSMWGARAGFGRGVQVVNVDGEKTKGATNFVALQGGFSSLPEDGLRLDMSANLVAGIGKSTAIDPGTGDEEDVASGFDIRLGALARGYSPINDIVDLGFLGNLSVNYENVSDEVADNAANDLGLGLMFGAGPSIHLDRAKIAAYGGVLAAYGRSEPNDDSASEDDETTHLQFALPVVNMATEVQLLDWLYVRTGAQYSWDLRRASVGDPTTSAKSTAGSFLWSAGLGVTKANFFFDGVVSNGFVTNGPAFIGGPPAGGFLVLASATYKFGDVMSGEVLATEPAPAAEPAAQPVEAAPADEPAAAPDQEASAPAVDATGTTTGAGTATGTSASGSAGASGSIGIGQ
jgi:hypothetical protein